MRLRSARTSRWVLAVVLATALSVPSIGIGGSTSDTSAARPADAGSTASGNLTCPVRFTVSPTAFPSNGTVPLTVEFSARPSGGCPPYQAEWSFGDGGGAEGINVTHTFRSVGVFDAYVEATDANGSEREARTTVDVTGGVGPLSMVVSVAPPSGMAPLRITAWGNVTGGNASTLGPVRWTFGDGGNGSGSPIQHTYQSEGTYVVMAVAASGNSQANGSATVVVRPGSGGGGSVNLSLQVDPSEARAPANITISTFSSPAGRPENLTLCYGDGTPCLNSTTTWPAGGAVEFEHLYTVAGNYSIQSWLTGPAGVIAGATTLVSLSEGPPLELGANVSLVGRYAPLLAEFGLMVSGGTPPYAVQWSYGDGSVGSSVSGTSVDHTYASAGTYYPTITVVDSAGNRAKATLPPILVRAAPSPGWLPSNYQGSTVAFVIFALLLAGSCAGVWFGRRASHRSRDQQLRKEGEELVRELEEEP